MCDFGMVCIRFSKASHLPQAKLIWEFLSRWGVCKQVSKHTHKQTKRLLKKPTENTVAHRCSSQSVHTPPDSSHSTHIQLHTDVLRCIHTYESHKHRYIQMAHTHTHTNTNTHAQLKHGPRWCFCVCVALGSMRML